MIVRCDGIEFIDVVDKSVASYLDVAYTQILTIVKGRKYKGCDVWFFVSYSVVKHTTADEIYLWAWMYVSYSVIKHTKGLWDLSQSRDVHIFLD